MRETTTATATDLGSTKKGQKQEPEPSRDASRELDALIAEMMEPKPEPISARALRATYRNWVWYSDHMHMSPDGWWTAQIGTDHGLPEKDDDPVRWRPAREPSANIEEAWLVVEAMRARSIYIDIASFHDGFTASVGWEGKDGDDIWRSETVPRDDSAPLVICRAALLAVGAA